MNFLKNIFFLLIYFYSLFTFTFESFNTIQRILIYIIPIITIILNFNFLNNRVLVFSKPASKSFLCYFLIITLSILVPTLYNTFDYTYLNLVPILLFKLAIKNIFLLIIFLKLFKKKASFYLYSKYYIMSCSLYVCFSLILMALPGLKDFWLSIIHITEQDKTLTSVSNYVSRVGVDGFAGFVQTFICSLGVLLNVYLIIFNNINRKRNHFSIYVSLFLLALGTLLYGRIGSLVAFVAIGLLISYFLTKVRNWLRGFSIIILIIGISLSIMNLGKNNEEVSNWTNWVFDYIINFQEEGKLSNSSTEQMFNMYFIPEVKTIMLGDGYYTDPVSGRYYMSSDIGFMRNLLFFGILPTAISYLILVFILMGINKEFSKKRDKTGSMLSISFFLFIILFEMKGGTYFLMYPILLPFYYLLVYENKKNKEYNEEI